MNLQKVEKLLTREYAWAAKRYRENETGTRQHGGNCFNEVQARLRRDELEAQYEDLGGNCAELKRKTMVR